MNQKKLFFLLSVSIIFFSSSTPIELSSPSITIVKSSESLDIQSFLLAEGKTILRSDPNFSFYAKIKSKKIKGKKVLTNLSKVKRSGTQYNVIYTYEYLPSGKKTHYNHKYILWEDGEIFNWKPTENINVGKITLKTEIQKE
ncbi:hypothetical protein [Aquimarina sp. 2201CG5-10]|uniref:hypothetical protein n=1 Tax=Aquimarina callyspongiae TaxID=3098150 RepID=UPI002AB4EA69|nr:hypothetical protein [Aquimarina sp. 2201CG5-10]MDY8134459.1 hypothetical protein [Aquimarina sp. 2201CG5-10]